MAQNQMIFGSLFTGIGGFDLAFQCAGMKCLWQSEIDPHCNRVLAARFPGVENLGDVKKIKRARKPDLICGGFPCQDLSVAGRRAGLAGNRSGLWFAFRDVLARLRPSWVVIENVPGLLSSNGGRDMGTILRQLGQFGYGWACRVLDAQHYGVPQQRRRVFIIGHLGDRTSAAKVLFEPQSCTWHLAPRRQKRRNIAAAIRSRSAECHALRGHDFGATSDARPVVVTHALKAEGADGSENGTGRCVPLVPDIINAAESCAKQSHAREASTSRALDQTGGFATNQGGTVVAFHEDQRSGGCYETKHTHALNQPGGKPGQGYPAIRQGYAVRRLTPRECERLQGFPDDWTAGLSDSARYRMLGNAVCVPVAEWIGRRIVGVNNERH